MEYDRSRGRVSNPETRKIDALSDKLERLLRRDQKKVNRIDEDDQEEVHYLNGQNRPTYYRNNFAPTYIGGQGDNAQGPPRTYQPRTYPLQGQGFQKAFNHNQGMQGKSPYVGERSDSNANRYQPPQQSNQVQPNTAAPTLTPGSRTDKLLQQILAGHQRLDSMHNHLNVKLDGINLGEKLGGSHPARPKVGHSSPSNCRSRETKHRRITWKVGTKPERKRIRKLCGLKQWRKLSAVQHAHRDETESQRGGCSSRDDQP